MGRQRDLRSGNTLVEGLVGMAERNIINMLTAGTALVTQPPPDGRQHCAEYPNDMIRDSGARPSG